MKLFMLWDMEGVSGLFTREHVWYWEPETRDRVAAHGLGLLEADVNSAVAAALRAGADEVIVCDTHHGGGNIRIPQMLSDPRVTYHGRSRGVQDGRTRWMPGLDETVDGFLLMGHHAKAGSDHAFLPHTNNLEWADFQINGQSVGEMGIEACYAGHWDVPVLVAQGDEAACREAEAQFPGVTAAAVKRALSRDLCTGLDPESARRLTAEKIAEAMEKARAAPPAPYKPTLPMRVTVRMRSTGAAEAAAQRPGVLKVDANTVEGVVERQCDVIKWLTGTGLD